MVLYQRDLGLDHRGDVAGHQPGRAGADDHHVAVEALRLALSPARVDLAALDHVDDLLGHQREQPEQHERADQPRRQDALQRADLRQLRAGVHVHQRAGQHAQLADPVEGGGLHRRQAHQQVDDEEREHRHQAQREQVERALALDAAVDVGQAGTEFRLDAVAQHVARHQHRQRRADAGGEGHHQRADPQAEDGTAEQRHDGRAGQRQRRHRHVDGEEHPQHQRRPRFVERREVTARGLDIVQAEEAAEVEREKADHQQDQRGQQQKLLVVQSRPRWFVLRRCKASRPYTRKACQPPTIREVMVMAHSSAKA